MIRAIIVDDEPKAVHKLKKHLEESGLMEVKGAFTNPSQALDAVRQTKIDAAFIDIEMPGLDGLTLANQMLDIDPGVSVVFVAADRGYAVQAFEINALDYLLKPVAKDRLKQSLDRLIKEKRLNVKG